MRDGNRVHLNTVSVSVGVSVRFSECTYRLWCTGRQRDQRTGSLYRRSHSQAQEHSLRWRRRRRKWNWSHKIKGQDDMRWDKIRED